MKKKNLKQLGNIIKDIINVMQAYEKDGVVLCPKTIIDGWQRNLFSIFCEENDNE